MRFDFCLLWLCRFSAMLHCCRPNDGKKISVTPSLFINIKSAVFDDFERKLNSCLSITHYRYNAPVFSVLSIAIPQKLLQTTVPKIWIKSNTLAEA